MNTTIYILIGIIFFTFCAIYFYDDNLREEIPFWFGIFPEYYTTGSLGIIPIFFRSLLCGIFWPFILYVIIAMIFFKLIYLILKVIAFLLGMDVNDLIDF